MKNCADSYFIFFFFFVLVAAVIVLLLFRNAGFSPPLLFFFFFASLKPILSYQFLLSTAFHILCNLQRLKVIERKAVFFSIEFNFFLLLLFLLLHLFLYLTRLSYYYTLLNTLRRLCYVSRSDFSSSSAFVCECKKKKMHNEIRSLLYLSFVAVFNECVCVCV